MGLTPLHWEPAPPEEEKQLGNEGWPLLAELLPRSEGAVADPDRAAREDALILLIQRAFGW